MASEISQMLDSSIVIIQGTVGLYTVATRCHTCFAVTLKYTEDSSLTILRQYFDTLWSYLTMFLLKNPPPPTHIFYQHRCGYLTFLASGLLIKTNPNLSLCGS